MSPQTKSSPAQTPQGDSAFEISTEEFDQLRALIHEQSGISLADTKRELLRNRLFSRLGTLGLSSFAEYHRLLTNDPNQEELVHCLDAISTNKTDFFRESDHFEHLETHVLPELIEQRKREGHHRLRIWSAGCSTGEEPHSLAMVLHRFIDALRTWDVKIVATDLSTQALARADRGTYPADHLKPISVQERLAHFEKSGTGESARWTAKPHIKSWLLFRRFNLMSPQFPFQGQFDFIFCRNVMIYFTKETQRALIGKFHQFTKPGGHLFIGHSETLSGLSTPWKFIKPTIYQRVEQ